MEIVSLNIGKVQQHDLNGEVLETGLFKSPTSETLNLTKVGLVGDEQQDLVHHGGEDKAICVYPAEHFPHWEKGLRIPFSSGAFGENLTLKGLTEDNVHIGDTFQFGEAVVQVSQPRQPCYKLAKRYSYKQFPFLVQEMGYTGFYLRVLKEGKVSVNSKFSLIEQDDRKITVQFANKIMHQDRLNYEGIKQILDVDALSSSWRESLSKRLTGLVEDTKERTNG